MNQMASSKFLVFGKPVSPSCIQHKYSPYPNEHIGTKICSRNMSVGSARHLFVPIGCRDEPTSSVSTNDVKVVQCRDTGYAITIYMIVNLVVVSLW